MTELEKKLYAALIEQIAINGIWWSICLDETSLDLEGFVAEPDKREIEAAKELAFQWYDINPIDGSK